MAIHGTCEANGGSSATAPFGGVDRFRAVGLSAAAFDQGFVDTDPLIAGVPARSPDGPRVGATLGRLEHLRENGDSVAVSGWTLLPDGTLRLPVRGA